MRVLVLSDVHGNIAALEAVAAAVREWDALVCLGDLVGYGPAPGPVVRWVRGHATVVVQGNHDRALADDVPPGCRPQFEELARAVAPLGQRQLTAEELAWLGALPRQATRRFDGVRHLFVHAAPSDSLYRYLGPDAGEWLPEVAGLEADVIVTGHTHLQFDLRAGSLRIVNPGSVGQPKDGDARAAYAILQDGEVVLERVAYPVEDTIGALREAGIRNEVVDVLGGLLRTGHVPQRPDPARHVAPRP